MNDYQKSKYIFSEKFFKELFRNLSNGDFFDINEMLGNIANEIKDVFLGTLLYHEEDSFLFTLFKEKIKRSLSAVVVNVVKSEPKKILKLKEKKI